jgi:integrase
MAQSGLDPTSFGLELSRQAGGFGPDEEWVQVAVRLFEVPTVAEVFPLFKAFRRLTQSVPWVCLLEEPGVLQARLDRILDRLSSLPKTDRAIAYVKCNGPFGPAGAIIGSDGAPTPGVENLRAALVLCQFRWSQTGGPRWSAAKDLASCIRNLIRWRDDSATRAQPVARHFAELSEIRTLPAFLDQAKALKHCGQASIERAWANHFEPELQKLPQLAPLSPAVPEPLPPDEFAPQAKPTKEEFDEDEAIDALFHGVRRATPQWPEDAPGPVEGEPADEDSRPQHVCPLPTRSTSPGAKSVAACQARQAIWGQNWLLLTNHPDVLRLSDLREVLGCILSELQSQSAEPGLRLGLTGLLLQAVTGRTTKMLQAFRLVGSHGASTAAGVVELCPDGRTLRLGVFWKEIEDEDGKKASYFRPTAEQEPLLEPVLDSFYLPVCALVANGFLKNRQHIERLVTMKPDAVDRHLRLAARHVSEKLGMGVTAGQVRRSFSAHVFERCRDTALTQLMCMDSLGQSTNPLSYYAPTRETIARAYWDTLCTLIPHDESMPSIDDGDVRVGCHLLLREGVARAMANAPSSILQASVEEMVSKGQAWRVHQAVVNHLACMFLALAGHRPVDALFELTMGELDAEAGMGLFLDKVFDPAHDPRLVALPTFLGEQLKKYGSHLQGLAAAVPGLAKHVRRVLLGQAPLLFHVTAEARVVELTIETWKPTLPDVWRSLPLNWGRSYIRTRGIELGLPPAGASIQLGHLEAVGYPFSNGSPTEPEAFAETVRPFLDKLARLQGWRVRTGIRPPAGIEDLPLRPLRPWTARIAKHEKNIWDRQKAWRLEQQSRMKSCRKQAQEDVLAHPLLVTTGIAEAFGTKTGRAKILLSRDQAESLREELYESAGKDLALALARSEVLRRILKRVNKRAGVTGQEPTRLISLRRPVDNAFVPGMFHAFRQVQALRAWMVGRAGKKPDNWRDFPRACARTVLAMVLFGFCSDPDVIMAVLGNRTRCVRSAVLDDTLFVPTSDDEVHPAVLRDLAALALGKLAKKYRNEALPSRQAIDVALAAMLPAWSLPARSPDRVEKEQDVSEPKPKDSIDLLDRLCQTVGVCNRMELSPAARLVMDRKRGSVSAHLREQLALIDGDPLGTLKRDWEKAVPPASDEEKSASPPSKGSARSQYYGLCSVIPKHGKNLVLPRTGGNIASGDLYVPSTRDRVIAEVRLMLAEKTPQKALQPIVRLLATWVLEMLEEGTQSKPDPADRTVETYLTRIGGSLVEILGNSSLVSVDGAELEDAYLTAVQAAGDSKDKAAAAVLSFHDCCSRRCGLPELDLSEVRMYLASDRRLVDARLILPAERDDALRRLVEHAGQGQGVNGRSRGHMRIVRQAGLAMPFYAFGGARRSEVLGTRFSDVSLRSDLPRMRIRANRSRRLKTRAARRIVEMPTGIAVMAEHYFSRWIEMDKSRLQPSRSEQAFVFSPLDAPQSAVGRNEIADTCKNALAEATGRATERLHRLRHLVAFERITPVFLCWEDAWRLSGTALRPGRLWGTTYMALPRDLMAEVITLGHAHWGTSLICYHHVPWLLMSRPQARISRRFLHRRAVASVLGVAQSYADEIVQGARDLCSTQAWFDCVQPARRLPAAPAPTRDPIPARHAWSAVELGALLDRVERIGSLEAALETAGGHASEAERIRLCAAPFELRFGRRLIGGIDEPLNLPKRVARKPTRDHALNGIWKHFDEDSDGLRQPISRIAYAVYDWMSRKDLDRIRLPAAEVDGLVALLRRQGVSDEHIRSEAVVGGQRIVRLERGTYRKPSEAPPVAGVERYLGIVLKRILGVVWLSLRLRDSPAPKC